MAGYSRFLYGPSRIIYLDPTQIKMIRTARYEG